MASKINLALTKKWGEKTHETIFPETHEECDQKCWGKNRRKKVRKNLFYFHTNIVTKKLGEKTRETLSPATLE